MMLNSDVRYEQTWLRVSIAVTLVLGASGVLIGVYARSRAIVFDGMYSLVDVVVTVAALGLVRLIATEGSRRFQYGFWHLEPLMEVFGGAALVLACLYAAVNAYTDLRLGRASDANVGTALLWVVWTALVGLTMTILMSRAAKRTGSGLLALDARGWLVSSALSGGIAGGFALALLLKTGPWSGWVRNADSLVLLAVSVALIPLPLRGIVRAGKEVAQIASTDLEERVSSLMAAAVADQGFQAYSSYVAKAGRVTFVEIEILTGATAPSDLVGRLDALRQRVAAELSKDGCKVWLTVGVTAEEKWL